MNRSIATPTTLRGLMLAALAIVAAPGALAAAAGNTLQSVDVQPLGTQGVQLVLTTSGPAPEPSNTFSVDNPARISFDLPGTSLALPQRRIDVGSNGLGSVVTAEADGRTRVVLNLDRVLAISSRVDGNRVIVTLGDSAGAPVIAATSAAAAAPRLGRGIQSIDFRRGSDGSATGRVIVRLGDPRTPVNLRQQGNQILVDFVGAELSPNLRRRFDVVDFATPVTRFDAQSTPNGAQLIISASGDFEQLAYQAEDQYVIEVQPRRVPRTAALDRPVYTGERMHATFQDIPTRTLLALIAETGGRNIVVSDSVSGSVTLRLENVPWDQVLDIVLRLKGLDKRVHDNVIEVGPIAEIANREKAQLEARREVQDLSPLRNELVQVNFAKAEDIAKLIRQQGTGSGGTEGGSLLSGRGSITVYAGTNTLLIQDTAESINGIRELVSQLDIPVRQVQIEARIVAVSERFSRDLGVRFGATGITGTGDGFISGTGSALANEDILGAGGAPFPGGAPFAPSRYNVNMPVGNPAGSLAFLVLGSDYLLDLELSAAQSEGQGEVISTPSITVANQQQATIAQGSEIPYQEAASSGATSVSFKDVKTSLIVTPLITPDNRLILDIAVQKQRVGQLIVGIGGGQIPSIDSSEVSTRVVVNDGQTVVLGGILETERRESVKKVPLLGDVPIFGHLFKSTSRTNNKDELLIFVTPKILREGVSLR